jgi:hypothetical protein
VRFRAAATTLGAAWVAVCSLAIQPAAQTPAAGAASPAISPEKDVLARYCVNCHGGRRPTAGLALDTLDSQQVGADAEKWEKVVGKLRARTMPPAGLPRPDDGTYERLAQSLEASLDAASAANPNPGRAILHRLNRAEYTNAVRDLLALEIDGKALLPADDSGYGFDNIADVLSVSPALLERYMIAAGKISRLAIGEPTIRSAAQTYSLRPTLLQHDRMSDDQPFGTRGGLTVQHLFPVDGDYLIKIRLQRTHASQIRGLSEPNEIEVRVDRRRVARFTVGGDGPLDPWSSVPSASAYEQTADDGLEVRVPVRAGARLVGVAFPKKSGLPEGVLEPRLSVATYEYAGDRDSPMSVATVQITGPLGPASAGETPSRRRIFSCYPTRADEEERCAKQLLGHLARRAYRRPTTDGDRDALLRFYRDGRAKGSFESGVELALRAVLVDPDFLFRAERPAAHVAPGTLARVTDVELASRLSFFLWSSIPDDELLELAVRGQLARPEVLERQVLRMLRDPKSQALVASFGDQWLHVRNLPDRAPDPEAFPDFDENLREAFQRETELFLESQLRDDRSVLDLLTANYTFVNERLARHYGIPNVYGSRFRRVTFPDDRRAGLLGQGSILTVTSYPNRTSPTLRGKWVLENLLGAPPPPPPPNVPSLDEAAPDKPLTVRARLEQHRKNPVCASCHAPMDPLGMALENFDAIGRWRTTENSLSIDPSAALPDGARFTGPAGLRTYLEEREERFAATVAQKLLTYALGRGLEHYDAPAVRKIVRGAASNEYRWSAIIQGIVESLPFQMRRS